MVCETGKPSVFYFDNDVDITLSVEDKPECWFEISLDESPGLRCICIRTVRLLPILEIGSSYRLIGARVKQCNNVEIRRLYPNHMQFEIITDENVVCEFMRHKEVEEVIDIKAAFAKIQTFDGLISFQGIIKSKDFCPPLSSRTARRSRVFPYGTPGLKTHMLYFGTDDPSCSTTLLLYLNNWGNIQMPFGLLPYMRLLGRNVQPQKRRYFKSTVFTTFQVLNYEPDVDFQTANLFTDKDLDHYWDWGKPFSLGLGNYIPNTVLVWCPIVTLTIRSLTIKYQCRLCSKTLDHPGLCLTCKIDDRILNVVMTLIATDTCGSSVLICKSVKVLEAILNLEKSLWEIWCKNFRNVGSYVYKSGSGSWFSNSWVDNMDAYLDVLKQLEMTNLQLLCRKLKAKPEDNDGLPLWFCTDARRAMDTSQ